MKNIKTMINKQKGSSLISLMIGLSIGLATMLTMFEINTMVQSNTFSQNEILKEDNSSMTALLSIQQQLSKAGYGIEESNSPSATKNVDIIVVSNASLINDKISGFKETINEISPVKGNAILYRYYDDVTSMCAGIYGANAGIYALLGQECNSLDNFESIEWLPYLIGGEKKQGYTNLEFSIIHKKKISTDNNSGCILFGKLRETGLLVSIESYRNIEILGNFKLENCLINIKK